MFNKVLVANRGEISLRVIRALREMSIASVAVYSDSDREARFVLEADEAYRVGPPPAAESYLNQTAIIDAAHQAGATAIHPGYGFLSENADFAAVVAAAGLTFVGPSPESMRLMGDKIAARRTAVAAGVPVVPGTRGAIGSPADAKQFVADQGLPVLVKAGGGGGGRGIRIVEEADQLEPALEAAAREAGSYFGNSEVYLERFFSKARHIEVQIAGDRTGQVIAWGERDCSVQRRRQKLIEETPAPGLADADRAALLSAAQKLAESASYVGVGTVEFLYVGPGTFYFLEMNTRIQVEHTITEAVTGNDLVRESILLAAGEPATTGIQSRGHAIEARINAEDPAENFRPGPGRLEVYREPGGAGVRVDSGVYEGFTIPGDYDSLISKLVVHAPDRPQAIARLLGALHGYRIEGVPSTVEVIANIVSSTDFNAGPVTTDWLDLHVSEFIGDPQPATKSGNAQKHSRNVDVEVNGKRFEVRVFDPVIQETERESRSAGGRKRARSHGNEIVSPMRGTVLFIAKAVGDSVEEGERVAVVEAMKMENEVRSPRSGRVSTILVVAGETVESHQPLMTLEA